MRSVILHIEGGIGKNILATGLLNTIQRKYPEHKIIIVTAHKDVWRNNTQVYKVYGFDNTENLYTEHINQDTIMMLHDPYRAHDYIHGNKHLLEVWCDLYGLDFTITEPKMKFTKLETDMVEMMVLTDPRPIAIIQAFGGAEQRNHKYSWMRDIPPGIAQEIVNRLSETHRVIQVRRPDQIELQGAESLSLGIRELAIALRFADKRILIDSFLQHAAFAQRLRSNVLWIGNDPKVLGYQFHNNILSTPIQTGDIYQSMYHKFDILGNPIQLDQDPNQLFDVEQLMKSLI